MSVIEVEAFLADSVVASEGKLYVQGAGWNSINTRMLPMRHDRVGVGVLIRVPFTATNQPHRFEIALEDGDGKRLPLGDNPTGEGKIEGLGGQFNVGRPPTLQAGDEQIVPFAVNINGLLFDNAGAYRMVISIDGEPTKHLPFRVTLFPDAQPIITPAKD